MSRPRLMIPAALVVAALALAGCDSDDDATDASAAPEGTSTSETVEPAAEESPAADAGTDADDATPDDAGEPDEPEVEDADEPSGELDPDAGHGPDDDAVTYPVTGSVLAPECGVVVLHPIDHEVVQQDYTEVAGGFECYSLISSKGDALFFADEIGAQLDEAGYEQMSWHGGDNSADAVNVFSYLVEGGELHVTVSQVGPASLETHYAFNSPARGNG